MLVDAHIAYNTLAEIPELVRSAEELGIDGLWFSETAHDPFLGAAIAAEHTRRVTIGTSVAIAFTRSPTLLAYLGWDLAVLSGGRFILGLGTQVKAHIVRRFGMPWDAPAPRLRDTVGAIHAVWHTWRTGSPLSYRGRGYTLNLMTSFFTPPPADAVTPIVTAGVNPVLCRVAGEVADGFQVHPLHTPAYLRNVIHPAIRKGQLKGGRGGTPFQVSVSTFVVTGTGEDEIGRARREAKRSIAFYASTPSYRGVLAYHGWQEVGQRLSALAARGAWAEMAEEISDEMLTTIAVVAPLDEVGTRIRERYEGLADRVGVYEPFSPRHGHRWRSLLEACRSG